MIITVTVISYNSETTILETLNSVLAQDYCLSKVEVIISDDSSRDKTLELCDTWINSYKHKFYNCVLIRSDVNTGVTMNCNRAWKKATGEWIKTIAADDILLDNCLVSNLNYVDVNPQVNFVFSRMQCFGAREEILPADYNLKFFDLSSNRQHSFLKYQSFNIAPSSFIKRKALAEVGFADETYKMFEDLPLWIKATSLGHKLSFNNDITVMYRIGNSISKSDTKTLVANQMFVDDLTTLYKSHTEGLGTSYFFKLEWLIYFRVLNKTSKIFNNERNLVTRMILKLTWIFRPLTLFMQFKNKHLN